MAMEGRDAFVFTTLDFLGIAFEVVLALTFAGTLAAVFWWQLSFA